MDKSILRMTNLTKTFIIGKNKYARKAQKALQKLQERSQELSSEHRNSAELEADEALLKDARKLYAQEDYEACYQLITGKKIHRHRANPGIVVRALRNVNLNINEGDLVAIVGPSGSGKSTLLNMLGLLDDPTSGEIYLRNKEVTDIRRNQLPVIRSKELGFVFQSFNLITTLTALENVMLPLRYAGVPKKIRKQMAQKALEQVGLGDRLHHTPNQLSGGQQQRVAIARSIVNNPTIICGDELTGDLDSKMTAEIMTLIEKLNDNGQTFVIVTHNPEVAKRCKRIIYMRDGEIEREEAGAAHT
jgi:putative ABC transport system ATP-binding protein